VRREDLYIEELREEGAIMRYDEWLGTVPEEITKDSLWKIEAYRLALFVAELCWNDIRMIQNQRPIRGLTEQLLRSVGSISANIAEGYSRSTGKSRALYYEYALGSAREARDWYYKCRLGLGEEITSLRLQNLTKIIRLLLIMVPQQRGYKIQEISINHDVLD
jgi:four helix bundle protein